MSAVIRQFRDFWPLLSALLMLALPDVAFAQQTRSQQAPPSILIGGYRVSLGMTIEQVNGSLSSVFTASMADSKSWVFRQGDQIVAKVFLENGRVSQIVKFFGVSVGTASRSDRLIRETKEAAEEFAILTRGYSCGRLQSEESPSRKGYQLNFRCGPYVFSYETLGVEDEMGSIAVIYVTR